ncbi:MAG: pentapeptide repeat-containing protein [Nostoc sp.]|uniref:pentapeptide repeat-containing protein n=1 Tax=Nostoc sp. TaxID=1180 RepID=UPI002FEFE72B
MPFAQDLVGANFSYADIRGADFSEANLRGANFSYAKAGLQPYQQKKITINCICISPVSGIISAIIAYSMIRIEYWSIQSFIADLISLIILILFFYITINQGFVLRLSKSILLAQIFAKLTSLERIHPLSTGIEPS